MEEATQKVRFGDYSFSPAERILRRDGEMVNLPSKVLEVLCLLVEEPGSVVSKEELMSAVWPDSFVEESNLTQSIYLLRRTLGRTSNGTNYVETIPKRGYRLAVPAVPDTPAFEPQNTAHRQWPRLLRPALIVCAVIGLVAVSSQLVARYLITKDSAPVEKVNFKRLTFSGDISFPVISPDGKSFAYVRGDSLYLQDIATGSNVKLEIPGHKKFGNLQFSSEGESIYFRDEESFDADGNLYQVSRFGGTPRLIADKVWSGVGESSDGSDLAFVRFYPKEGEWAVILRERNTGQERKILSRNLPYTIYRSGYPAFSPNGGQIAIVEQTPERGNVSKIVLVDVASGEATRLETPQFVQIEQLGWLPHGRSLVVTGREDNRFFQLYRLPIDGGEPSRITNDLNIYRNLSVSADGKRLVARQYSIHSHIWTAPVDALSNQKQITYGNLNRDGNAGIALAADGSILYASRITGNIDIWSVEPESGVRRQLTENAGMNNENPFISADGKFVFYESTRSGRRKIWRSNIDGSNPTQLTTDKEELDFLPVVSPDGADLYYISRHPRSNVIWRQSIADGTREMITQQGKTAPEGFLALSPVGKTLAFRSQSEGSATNTTEINFLNLGTGELRTIKVDIQMSAITFSENGMSLDYAENRPGGAKIWRMSTDGSSPARLLAEIPAARIFDMCWSPDQKTLALARGRQDNDAILLENLE